jgi:hypothetical protein
LLARVSARLQEGGRREFAKQFETKHMLVEQPHQFQIIYAQGHIFGWVDDGVTLSLSGSVFTL